MMMPSISSIYFADLSPEDALARFAAAGYAAIEIGNVHGLELMKRPDPERTGRAFAAAAAGFGIALSQGHLKLAADIACPDEKERRETVDFLKAQLRLYAACGVKAAVLHPGGNAAVEAGWMPEEIAELRTASLLELCGAIAELDIRIALETMYQRPFGAAELHAVIARAGNHPRLGVCMDTGHLNLAGHDPAAFVAAVGDRLIALHIADNRGTADEHLLPYAGGTVNWKRTVAALKKRDWRGPFNFETNGDRNDPPAIRQAKLGYCRQLAAAMLDLPAEQPERMDPR